MERLTKPRPLEATDDLGGFDCGQISPNTWLRRRAWQNQIMNISRTSVTHDTETLRLVGFVTLCAAEISRIHLPKPMQRNRPEKIPALLLGQFAIDKHDQGKGYSKSLMFFALQTAVMVSRSIGCHAVLTHPLDDDARSFYKRFGFAEQPFDSSHSMFLRIADIEGAGFS